MVCFFKLAIFLFVGCVLGDQGDTIDARVLKLEQEIVKLQNTMVNLQVNDQNDSTYTYLYLHNFKCIYDGTLSYHLLIYLQNVAAFFCKIREFEIIQYQSKNLTYQKFMVPSNCRIVQSCQTLYLRQIVIISAICCDSDRNIRPEGTRLFEPQTYVIYSFLNILPYSSIVYIDVEV
jgi:hypothetical protein